ncbi:MAG: GNAT family N-acetyltransferase [Erysipelotrichaceae bacterium]|nr:GNAT family N-acetyltransferase [Erysipelotrichaceae bacterium]
MFSFFKREIQKNDPEDSENEVVLKERYRLSAEETSDGIPTVYYDIFLKNGVLPVGKIDLRLKMDDYMYYLGHIGYHVYKVYRGHSYAYKACLQLFRIAREEFGLSELIITCSPDNIASYKTLVKLGGKLIETVPVPVDHELYRNNERIKCIFKYKL